MSFENARESIHYPRVSVTVQFYSVHARHLDPRASVMTLRWRDKLKPSGLYYDGFIQGKELDHVLEDHRRDTASTFGTRKSSNVSAAAAPKRSGSTNNAHANSDENVNIIVYMTL